MGPFHRLQARVDSWREKCDLLRRWGAPQQAKTLESATEELETDLRELKLELLTLRQAERETHWTYDTLQRKVGSEIPNAGEKGSPRVRRCDLHPWIDAPEPELHDDPVEELAESTLQAREENA
mgnify:CR=1 FL=1